MTESVLILTTTGPHGEFDIFSWTEWLENATLAELYINLGCMKNLIIHYTRRKRWAAGDYYTESVRKIEMYENLHHHIGLEIADRTIPAFKPQAPN